MPTIQIYLNQELLDFVKKNKSKIVQQALNEYKDKLTAKKKSSTTTDAADDPA